MEEIWGAPGRRLKIVRRRTTFRVNKRDQNEGSLPWKSHSGFTTQDGSFLHDKIVSSLEEASVVY